jgi:hypothetical protein
MADTSAIEVPADLAQVAQEKGIPLDLVRRGLALGFPPEAVQMQLSQPGVTAEAAEAFIAEQERIRAGGEITIPPEVLEVSRAKGWPDDLIKRAIKLGAPPEMMINQINAGITPEQAERFIEMQEQRAGGGEVQLDLAWMKVPTEWGIRVKPGKKGLTVGMINVGTYADIPDYWPYQTEMPRGAVPIPGVEGMGYSIFEKQEVWSDACAKLYEEAIQRRWRPATDVPWDSIQPLPDDLERAICQICTHISEKEQMEADVLGKWEPEISYGYHEVKLYLATTIFENARAVEVFRKRALSNGGGLGVQATGWAFRSVVDARNFTEMSSIQMVLLDGLTLTQFAYGEKYAKNPAEQFIFAHCLQDKARHVAYGITHMKYALLDKPDRREEIQRYLDKGETMMLMDDRKDPSTREAFAIYFGGGKDNIAEGLHIYDQMRKTAVQQYLARLKWATLDRSERLNGELKAYLDR